MSNLEGWVLSRGNPCCGLVFPMTANRTSSSAASILRIFSLARDLEQWLEAGGFKGSVLPSVAWNGGRQSLAGQRVWDCG